MNKVLGSCEDVEIRGYLRILYLFIKEGLALVKRTFLDQIRWEPQGLQCLFSCTFEGSTTHVQINAMRWAFLCCRILASGLSSKLYLQ